MWGLKGQASADSSAYSKVKEINTINRSTKTIAKCVSDNTDINIITYENTSLKKCKNNKKENDMKMILKSTTK